MLIPGRSRGASGNWGRIVLNAPKAGDEIEQAMLKLRSETQVEVVALSGGEPTLRSFGSRGALVM